MTTIQHNTTNDNDHEHDNINKATTTTTNNNNHNNDNDNHNTQQIATTSKFIHQARHHATYMEGLAWESHQTCKTKTWSS